MKSVTKMAAVAAVAMAGVIMPAGAANAAADDIVVAKIPFAFVVNGVALPAGDYVITRDARQPDLIAIATAAGERVTLTLTRGGEDKADGDQPKLEFERIGKLVYLTQVTLGARTIREIPVPASASTGNK